MKNSNQRFTLNILNAFVLLTSAYVSTVNSIHVKLELFQRNPTTFNRASLLNIGYLEAMKTDSYDCIVFHDVDIYMEDGRAMYTCDFAPLHLAAYTRGHDYQSV